MLWIGERVPHGRPGVFAATSWFRTRCRATGLATALLAAVVRVASAQTLADVPGTVVYWRISPASVSGFALPPDRVYTTSPSIAVLPNGDYLLSFNLFGSDLVPPAETSGTTYIYRSTDQGQTWTNMTPTPMMDVKRGSLFVFGSDVFLWGFTAAPGNIIIRTSSDDGTTWTEPVDGMTGLLVGDDTFGGTPHNPVVHGGRLWTAVGGKRLMSVSTTRDFLDATRWAGPSPAADTEGGPLGPGLLITEAQIVASPATGVVLMPKIDGVPYTVLIRAAGNGAVADPTDDDWVALPGAEKKFGAAYDSVSEKFYVLSNPVLPVHQGTPGLPAELIRNTAAMSSSRDLVHWDVEQIFLYSPNIGYEAFQYLNFDVDGDDLVVASRTAFDLTGEPGVDHRPPRGHDSNLVTFHRIPGFRTAAPTHYLTTSGSQVLRYEKTQHADAPLGSFVMGSTFEGVALGALDGIAQGVDGEVLVREAGGRVLRFDALGNFLGIGSGSGVTFTSGLDPVAQPAPGERGWTAAGGGAWEDLTNWHYWNRPDTNVEVANFGSAIGADAAITTDRTWSVRGLRFRNPRRYTIAGSGGIELAAAGGGTTFAEAQAGGHSVAVPVRLASDARFEAAAGAGLELEGGVDVAGRTLHVQGAGTVRVGQSFDLNGGVLVLEGASRLHFATGTTNDFGGTLDWRPAPGTLFQLGDTFPLFEGVGGAQVSAGFTTFLLPDPGPGLGWDVTALYTAGTVSVAPLGCGNGSVTLGESCDDGNTLDGDCCSADCTLMQPNGAPCAADTSACTADVCNGFGTCTHLVSPNPSCQPALFQKGLLHITKNADPARDRIGWKWKNASSVEKEPDFGDPESGSTSFTLCVFDGAGRLLLDLTAPAGGTCGRGPCWKEISAGFRYKDLALDPDGVRTLVLREGATAGKAMLTVTGKGANLATPVLPMSTLPVRTRLIRSDSTECWESRYSAPMKNDGTRFRAKSD